MKSMCRWRTRDWPSSVAAAAGVAAGDARVHGNHDRSNDCRFSFRTRTTDSRRGAPWFGGRGRDLARALSFEGREARPILVTKLKGKLTHAAV